jgi:hypothetical protein
MPAIDLSILIPTLFNRKVFLFELLGYIESQPKELLDRCEVIISCDSMTKTIGQKRNELLRQSNGRYSVFIDCDDTITPSYLQNIFKGIDADVDHVGIMGTYIHDGNIAMAKNFKCSKDFPWIEKDGVYLRGAQHICAIKTDVARMVNYPHTSFGEDSEYSKKISPLIKTEYLITEPIYIYKYRSKK